MEAGAGMRMLEPAPDSPVAMSNGVGKGPLKRNYGNSAISTPCQKRTTVLLGDTECASAPVFPILCVVKTHNRALEVHDCTLFPDFENLIFLPPMRS